jgi:hypothetical protein
MTTKRLSLSKDNVFIFLNVLYKFCLELRRRNEKKYEPFIREAVKVMLEFGFMKSDCITKDNTVDLENFRKQRSLYGRKRVSKKDDRE